MKKINEEVKEMAQVKAIVRKEGYFFLHNIRKEEIPTLLELKVFDEIRVNYNLLTAAEVESITGQGVSVRLNGDSKEAVFSLE